MVLPRRPDAASASKVATLSVKRVLEFSSEHLRSGVVVSLHTSGSVSDAPPGSALLFLRGAPGAIKGLVEASSVPPDFDQVCLSVPMC